MTEVDATNEPGLYTYELDVAALDYAVGFPGYLFILSETTTSTLLHELVVPLRRQAWEDDRVDHQTPGTFGGDLVYASVRTPGAVGDLNLTIEDMAASPVEGATVRVFDSTGTTLVSQGITDANGEVSFGLPAGTYQVRTRKSGTDFASSNPTVAVVVPNDEVVPQLDGILPTSASLGDRVVLYGRYFGTTSVEVVFGTESPAPVDAVDALGTVAVVDVPATLTGVAIPVKLQKPDPNNLPSGVLQSNTVTMMLV